MKTLYAGPWVGEFGWELMWWNPYIRYMVATGNYDQVIISGPTGSEYL